MNTQPSVPAFITHANLKCKKYIHLCDEICVWFHLKVGNSFCSLYQEDWRNLMKQSVTVGAQLLWGGRYGCNNGRYGCTIVMSYIEINKAVSQWLLTFNLCVSVTWPLTCAFHIPCTHTPEIIDMHRGVCDNIVKRYLKKKSVHISGATTLEKGFKFPLICNFSYYQNYKHLVSLYDLCKLTKPSSSWRALICVIIDKFFSSYATHSKCGHINQFH